jgi:2-oxoglutarate ferredoxin oxidoreductase subunit alpha
MSRELISTGNELAALAAIDSKCEFFGGYPITPSSEIMHVLSSATSNWWSLYANGR